MLRVGGGGDTWIPTNSSTIYAVWTPNTYTVTFNGTGGSAPDPTSKVVTYDSAYGTLPILTRSGYIFSGWYTELFGGTRILESTLVSITESQNLYAQWTSMALWKIKTNGVYKLCSSNYFKLSGSWKRIVRFYIKVDGVWTPLI